MRQFLSSSHFVLPALMLLAQPVSAHDHEHGAKGLEFHENKGQWPAQVLFRAMTPGGAVFIEPDAFTHVVRAGGPIHGQPTVGEVEPYRMHAYRVRFAGGHATNAEAAERRTHYANYFLGNDPAKWAGGVGIFGEVDLKSVYPGIDLHVSGEQGLKYDWELAPGADAARIELVFEGQDALAVKGGMLYIGTNAGEVVEQRPVAWSVVDGEQVRVACEYALEGNHVRYIFPNGYDKRHALVIDPVVSFCTFSGSFADNFGFTATYDNNGHLYGGGIVFGVGYPTSLGAFQAGFGGDVIDMGITKFATDGGSLIWSTYLGGTTGNESPHSMVVNGDDELYVMGTSGASDFPTSTGCFDNSFGAGPSVIFVVGEGYNHLSGSDIVVAHLSADATTLLGGTYVGGSQADGLNLAPGLDYNYGDPFRGEIVLDHQEHPVFVSSTLSPDMPVSVGAPQAVLAGGQDAFVCRMDPALSTIEFASYHGGSADDAGFGLQIAGDDRLYITGGTMSFDLTMPLNAYHQGHAGGADGYIARFEADGSALSASTYLGTPFYDQSYFVQIDLAGFVYVVGQTRGAYPITPGHYSNPNSSQFIHKLDHDLTTSQWSTLIGSGQGFEDISPSAFLVSDCGQIYFSGWGGAVNTFGQADFSTTVGLPVTADAFQSTTDGSDFYLMVLNADASSLAYATFFGGAAAQEHVDGGTSRFDKSGIVYQAVCASCGFGTPSFPTTPGAYSSTDNGMNCNLGVFKIDFEQNVQVVIDADITATGACITEPVVFNAVGTANEWLWDLGDGTQSTDATLAHLYDDPGTYTVMLIGTANASGLCVAVDTAYLEISVVAPLVMDPQFVAEPTGTCNAASVELFNMSTGSTNFIWSFGDNTGSTQTNPVHPYAAPGSYTITLGVIDLVCADTVYTSQIVDIGIPGLPLDLTSPVGLCDGTSAQLSAPAGYDSYLWSTGQPTQTITVDEPGEYVVVVTEGFCTGTDTIIVTPPVRYERLADRNICPGQDASLVPPFEAQSILWSTGSNSNAITVDEDGTYWFTATDPYGCLVTDTVEVVFFLIGNSEAFVPNVFWPNGDDKNEVFRVEGVDAAADFQMDVYNRWGQRVFETSTGTYGWNGKLRNDGETVPDGTYFVIVTYKDFCKDKDPVTVTGHVTLLR